MNKLHTKYLEQHIEILSLRVKLDTEIVKKLGALERKIYQLKKQIKPINQGNTNAKN